MSTQPYRQSHGAHVLAAEMAMQQKREASMVADYKRIWEVVLRMQDRKTVHQQPEMGSSSSRRTQLSRTISCTQAASLGARFEISSQNMSKKAASFLSCSQTSRLPSQPSRSRACRKACRQQRQRLTARRLTWRNLFWRLSWCPRRPCRQGLSPAAARGCMRLRSSAGQWRLLHQSLRPSLPLRCAPEDPVTLP